MPERVIGTGTSSSDSGSSIGNDPSFNSVTTNIASVADELDIPVYDDPTNAVQNNGQVIFITGNNTSYPGGIYSHNGTQYVRERDAEWV